MPPFAPARTRTVVRRSSSPQTITVRMPSGGSRLKKYARAGVSAAGRAAASEKHTMVALGAAALHGYMTRPGTTPPQHVEALGTAGTYGSIAWAIGKFFKSPVMSHAATGLLCIQVDRWTREGGPGSSTPPAGGGAAPMHGVMRGTL